MRGDNLEMCQKWITMLRTENEQQRRTKGQQVEIIKKILSGETLPEEQLLKAGISKTVVQIPLDLQDSESLKNKMKQHSESAAELIQQIIDETEWDGEELEKNYILLRAKNSSSSLQSKDSPN